MSEFKKVSFIACQSKKYFARHQNNVVFYYGSCFAHFYTVSLSIGWYFIVCGVLLHAVLVALVGMDHRNKTKAYFVFPILLLGLCKKLLISL